MLAALSFINDLNRELEQVVPVAPSPSLLREAMPAQTKHCFLHGFCMCRFRNTESHLPSATEAGCEVLQNIFLQLDASRLLTKVQMLNSNVYEWAESSDKWAEFYFRLTVNKMIHWLKTAEEGKTTLEKMLANFVTFVEGWWASSNYMFMRYVVFILHAIQTKSKEKYVILTAGWMCVNILTCARLKCHLIDLLCWQKCCHFHLSVHQCHVVWVFLLNSPTVQAYIDQYYS